MAAHSPTPGSTASLRTANQRRVLDLLLHDGATTQAEIARSTGLATGTVSSIVRELAAAEIVSTVAGAGRRGTTVELGPGAGTVAAVDFGHRHVTVALAGMGGTVLQERTARLPAAYGVDAGLGTAEELFTAVLRDAGIVRAEVRTLGMGLPCPIVDGVASSSVIMPAWTGVVVRREAERWLQVPVVVDNDANLGALGEHRLGAGRGHRNLVFVKVSSGVGAGLILEDRLFHGRDGTAGEVGHLTLDEQGPLCRCGSRGCLEAYAATGPALALLAAQLPESEDGGIDAVVAMARAGNVAAQRVFEDAGLHLGWGLAAITNLLNPDVFAVGGDMSHAGDLLLDSVRTGLRRHVLSGANQTPVEIATFGDRASLVGALVLARESTDLLTEAV